jgi:hypothetical protein
VYRKDTGAFAGSGTALIEDEIHGSTEVAPISEDQIWNNSQWTGGLVDKLQTALAAASVIIDDKDETKTGDWITARDAAYIHIQSLSEEVKV